MPITRRSFLGSCASLSASSLVRGAPAVLTKGRPRIRVLGTHVTLQEDLRLRAQEDLGIDVSFEPGGSAQVLHKASTDPDAFDLYEQWSNSLTVLWLSQAVQPIDIARLKHWNEVNSLTKTGRLAAEAPIGAGDAPYKLLYVDKNQKLTSKQTDQISFLPYVHNVDSFGYDTRFIAEGKPYETESWGWLLDDAYRGKVAIVNAPTIGLFDLVLAAKARGLAEFADIGNLTRRELDHLFTILVDYKRKGHFRGVWSSVPSSVELMQNNEVVVESMFSPAVSTLNGLGIPCIYAAPKEGYRAWHGVMCLSTKTRGREKDAAYEYMNWWLSGWPGAFIARQGYYISTPQFSKPHLTGPEWDYWYEGKPATTELRGTDGRVSVRKGQLRRGGSYIERFSNVAVWNTVMETYEYSLRKWYEFLMA